MGTGQLDLSVDSALATTFELHDARCVRVGLVAKQSVVLRDSTQSSHMVATSKRIVAGRSDVVTVMERARTSFTCRDGVEVQRVPITLATEDVSSVRP